MIFSLGEYITAFCIVVLFFVQYKVYCTDSVWEPPEGISLWRQENCQFPNPEDTPDVAPRKEWADGVSEFVYLTVQLLIL